MYALLCPWRQRKVLLNAMRISPAIPFFLLLLFRQYKDWSFRFCVVRCALFCSSSHFMDTFHYNERSDVYRSGAQVKYAKLCDRCRVGQNILCVRILLCAINKRVIYCGRLEIFRWCEVEIKIILQMYTTSPYICVNKYILYKCAGL